MTVNLEVRSRLLKKLGTTSQALNARVGALAKRLAIPSDEALYLLAHRHGVNLSKHLSGEKLANVRQHMALLAADEESVYTPPRASRKSEQVPQFTKRVVSIRVGTLEVNDVPCMGQPMVSQARQVAEDAYPKLFPIENSARELISRVMEAAEGPTWWSVVDPALQAKSERYAASELREAWHPARGKDPIQFVDLPDLVKIVEDRWDYFKHVFPKKSWFGHFINELNVSRRVVAHMSPLKKEGMKYVDASFSKWVSQLAGVAASIPTS